MSNETRCARCHRGPVHRFDGASQCESCGAYTDARHRYHSEPLPRTSAASVPVTSGRPGPMGLQILAARQLMPDLP